MSDLDHWKIHGPVETLRSEFATWDSNSLEWQSPTHFNVASFRVNGAIFSLDAHNPDGSIVHSRWLYNDAGRMIESNTWKDEGPIHRKKYLYDDRGRHLRTLYLGVDGISSDIEISSYDADGQRTKVCFLSLPHLVSKDDADGGFIANTGYSIEGTDTAYGAPGATTMTTSYDEMSRPAQVAFHDASHCLLSFVKFVRDTEGRVLREEMRNGEKPSFHEFLDRASPEQQEQLAALFAAMLGDTLWSTSYGYDAQGRRVTREHQIGTIGGNSTMYLYEDRDDPVEETTKHQSREGSLDEIGGLQYSSDRVSVQHNRLEYIYDTLDNWTERTVSFRSEVESRFQYSNRERRVFTYYPAE